MILLQNINFSYNAEDRRETGVSGLNLHIRAGECVVLCGKSGCGKTTVTRLINGLIPHFYEGRLDGKVMLGGEEISEQPIAKTAERVGSVFQNPRSQFFNVDTTSELAFGCENQGLPPDEIQLRVNHAKSMFSLGSLMHRSIFELSGRGKGLSGGDSEKAWLMAFEGSPSHDPFGRTKAAGGNRRRNVFRQRASHF